MTKQTEKSIQTLAPAAGVPAFMATSVHADAGKGVSTAAEDNIVPLVRIIQSNSRCLKRSLPDFIEGAMSGDIMLKGFNPPTAKEITFQPCAFFKAWVERVPFDAGGGFIGQTPELPSAAKGTPDPKNPNIIKYTMPNGNEVIETRYHAGFVHLGDQRLPFVIPMAGSNHTPSKSWMFSMGNKLVNGEKAPSWSCLYKMTTREKTNTSGTFSIWEISDAGWVQSEEDYNAGKLLFEAFEKGEKKAEEDTDDAPAAAATTDDTM